MPDPNDYPVFDPDTILDGDTIYYVLQSENVTQAAFRTEADTEQARTGSESLGVQFIDQSVAGDPDGIFFLDDGTAFDAEFDHVVDP